MHPCALCCRITPPPTHASATHPPLPQSVNAAFVPFRLVNYLALEPANIAAAVSEVATLICQEEKYEASE